jgi:hypothetical protein
MNLGVILLRFVAVFCFFDAPLTFPFAYQKQLTT